MVNNKLFAGAGVIVRKPGGEAAGESITVVETQHAKEVSSLIFALKTAFENDLDYFNKYEFYGRLADAANAQLQRGDDLAAIRKAVLAEACVMAAEMGKHLYFAYGSNMDIAQMADRCPDAVFVETATLQNHEFELDCTGAATVVESHGSTVHGVLWLISSSDERELDQYEGVRYGCYRKAVLPVLDGEGGSLPALVYVSNRDVHDGITYRSGYMPKIIANAKRLGFSEEYIQNLRAKLVHAN